MERLARAIPALLLALNSTGTVARAQDPVAWARALPADSAVDEPRAVVARPGGGSLVAIRAQKLKGLPRPGRLVALDENGDTDWVYDAGTPGATHSWMPNGVQDVALDASGDAYLVSAEGTTSRLVRLGVDGSLVWSRELTPLAGGEELGAVAVRVDPAGRVIVGATNTEPIGFGEVVLLAFDGAGNALWSTWFAGGLELMEVDPAGGVITLGGDHDHWYDQDPAYLVRHRPDGTFDWQVQVSGYAPVGLAIAPSGAIHCAVNDVWTTRVAAFAPDGSSLWHDTVVGAKGEWWISDLDVAADGSTWIVGERYSSGSEWWVARYASGGTQAWSRLLDDPDASSSSAHAVVVGSNGVGRVTGVRTLLDPPQQWSQAWTVAYDAAGTELWSAGHGDTFAGVNAGRLLALDASGDVLLAGTECVSDEPNKGFDAFVAKFLRGAPQGDTYCDPAVANSTGLPARIWAYGSNEVAVDDLSLVADQLPADRMCLFLNGRTRVAIPGVGGGQGTLCVGGGIGRYRAPGQLRVSDAAGRASLQLHLDATPTPSGLRAIVAGETWTFQLWYRDENPTWTSNLSDAVEVIFQ